MKTMNYRIGVAGPIEYLSVNDLLCDASRNQIVEGRFTGNGGTPVVLLVRELIRRGRRVVVFTLDPSLKPGREITLTGPNLTIRASGIRDARSRAIDLFATERRFIVDAIRQEHPDLVHAHWTYEFALAATASGAPTVATAHDAPWSVLRYDHHPYRIFRTLMALISARRVSTLTAVSPYVARHWRKYLCYRGELTVIPNGMPEHMFHAGPRDPPRNKVFTFATILQGWSGRKNGQAALLAFSLFRRSHPECVLLMYGEGHGNDGPAERWASSRFLVENVRFLGTRPYETLMDEIDRHVDVLVHPSLEESHGMVLTECMSIGIPTIGGIASGAVPFTLDFGRAGLLCDVRSHTAIAKAMSSLFMDRERYKRISASGRKYASDCFSIRNVADRYEEVYAGVVARHRHRRQESSKVNRGKSGY
jgi:glycosyltransferase involved in cell wall biosynthesis